LQRKTHGFGSVIQPEEALKMNIARIAGIILTALGGIVVLGSALADFLTGHPSVFGYKQIIGVAVGAIAVAIGLVLLLRKKA
jgi:hypothetical protein